MRKIPLLVIPLLFSAFMLNAQQNGLSGRSQGDTLLRQKQTPVPERKRMNSQVAHRDKLETQGEIVLNDKGPLKVPQKNLTNGKVPVTIKCTVTRELIKLISNAGGDVIDGSKEDNIIIANVPAAAIKKISASPDVKKISLMQTPLSNSTTVIK